MGVAHIVCHDYKLWTVRHIVDFLTLQNVSAKYSAGQRLDL